VAKASFSAEKRDGRFGQASILDVAFVALNSSRKNGLLNTEKMSPLSAHIKNTIKMLFNVCNLNQVHSKMLQQMSK
jgi:hypothetical protein